MLAAAAVLVLLTALLAASPSTRSSLACSALGALFFAASLLLVYLGDQLFHAVPKNQVEEAQVSALRTALERHGVPRR